MMKEKKNFFYVILVILLIASTIIIFTKGPNVGTYYSKGKIIRFTIEGTLDKKEVQAIVNEIWPGQDVVILNVEFFSNSASIKLRDYTPEELDQLVTKVNEYFSEDLTVDDFTQETVSNIRIRNIVEPYAIPTLLSLVLIMIFYSIRYQGTKEMLRID